MTCPDCRARVEPCATCIAHGESVSTLTLSNRYGLDLIVRNETNQEAVGRATRWLLDEIQRGQMDATQSIAAQVANLERALGELAELVDDHPTFVLAGAVDAWSRLEEANRVLAGVRADLADLIGRAMGKEKRYTAAGVTVERHKAPKRTAWDSDGLLRAVLDARLVDTDTGEVTEHTPLDRVRFVWSLGTPRVTALRALGLDPDAFCTTEQRDAWTLRPYKGDK